MSSETVTAGTNVDAAVLRTPVCLDASDWPIRTFRDACIEAQKENPGQTPGQIGETVLRIIRDKVAVEPNQVRGLEVLGATMYTFIAAVYAKSVAQGKTSSADRHTIANTLLPFVYDALKAKGWDRPLSTYWSRRESGLTEREELKDNDLDHVCQAWIGAGVAYGQHSKGGGWLRVGKSRGKLGSLQAAEFTL